MCDAVIAAAEGLGGAGGAPGGERWAVLLFDALAIEWAWTLGGRCKRSAQSVSPTQRSQAPHEAIPEVGGRPVDAETRNRRPARNQKELISRNFAKPSIGLEPMTPSLPSQHALNLPEKPRTCPQNLSPRWPLSVATASALSLLKHRAAKELSRKGPRAQHGPSRP